MLEALEDYVKRQKKRLAPRAGHKIDLEVREVLTEVGGGS